jgi:hypothetical protein
MAHRITHEVSGSTAIKLAHNLSSVRLYRLDAYAETSGDCLACMSFRDEFDDFALSGRQGGPRAMRLKTNCAREMVFAACRRLHSIDQMTYRF